ncbi:alpha/beta hydrolase [Shewanella ulleungensis]|jgi:predicted alpha/beta superfamily hydrolase|uniref:Esterase n=1 Tax=Shewanella ulleungensis TaxID=2282699 RepID=A0ABQ2QNP2_9GAMM|nr:alpha/beta hydrolase-fold protein [Shewanella ulleungensis]MCL1150463.1 alpha/beta hydrolase [Shewanella ulleungensis]GGP87454.1 esterase [Shewanella ulleungensis]
MVYRFFGLLLCSYFLINSLFASADSSDNVQSDPAIQWAEAYASASAVNIPRTRQFTLKDGRRDYQVMIKLPKDYQQNSTHHYPVIYMTDAMYSMQVVSGATRFPMNSNMMHQAILVAIGYQKGSKGASSRIRDYTPSHDPSWKLNTGEAKRHVHFIRDTVMPFVEHHYRVDTQQNTFMGNSLGGLLGAYILLEQPTLFAHYVLGSPSLWFDNKLLLQQFIQGFNQMPAISAKVFIGIGELERPPYTHDKHQMVADAQAFYQILQSHPSAKMGILQLKILVISEADHSMAFPTTAIHGLSWLFKRAH